MLYFSVEWLVLDEADKLFEEGKDGFREQVFKDYFSLILKYWNKCFETLKVNIWIVFQIMIAFD